MTAPSIAAIMAVARPGGRAVQTAALDECVGEQGDPRLEGFTGGSRGERRVRAADGGRGDRAARSETGRSQGVLPPGQNEAGDLGQVRGAIDDRSDQSG
nr:hypothetical protein [Gordonia araii]